MTPQYDVFIAYSRYNRDFVERLTSDLRKHHVKVWVDTLELKVGEQFRQRIEDGIEQSRFFCFVLSDASLKSYFARTVELESAFARMVKEKSESFILPLRLRCREKPPLQLSTYHYLDFSSRKMYTPSFKALVNRILQIEELFTGARLYKNVDTSMTGTMVGVGEPLRQAPYRGTYVKVFFENGLIRSMETYTDGKADGAKSVVYDKYGRVSEIVLFRNNQVIDSWRYEYKGSHGVRKYKWVSCPGEHPHQRLAYDLRGNKISEENVSPEGILKNNAEGWAIKRYVRDATDKVTGHEFFDERKQKIRTAAIPGANS